MPRDYYEVLGLSRNASEQDIIEKIDIGGISLIRAAAKNFKDVLVVSSMEQYVETIWDLLQEAKVCTVSDIAEHAGV